ncbi:MAG TPA: high-potential iron-sulfur protein [Steroidobacteraceae bacterium]|jgi:hypothetical protein
MNSGRSLKRRALLRILGASAAVTAALHLRAVRGAEPGKLDVKDPAAIAQGYVEKSTVAGSTCENCLLLQGSAGAGYRPCSLFPGKLVSSSGWCKGWTPEV